MEWAIKTGRREEDIRSALQKLVDRGYLEWVDQRHPVVKVIHGWENPYM